MGSAGRSKNLVTGGLISLVIVVVVVVNYFLFDRRSLDFVQNVEMFIKKISLGPNRSRGVPAPRRGVPRRFWTRRMISGSPRNSC